ncbi:MAG: hypothetical protein HQ463_09935 [Bacteroidetes bacterium]|nr:hypothetical protein [Bacteroidota bacterium]
MIKRFKIQCSILFQKLKRPLNNCKNRYFLDQEIKNINLLEHSSFQNKAGTLIVKCDDIGDYLVWQNTWKYFIQNANSPLFFIGNIVWKSLFEKFNIGAAKTFWIDKKQWGNESYRNEWYKLVNELNVETAITPLFTRNNQLDDLLIYASNAKNKIAWYNKDNLHNTPIFIQEIKSSTKHTLEYFRNIEFANQLYNLKNEFVIEQLMLKKDKTNTLVIFPMANIRSKCWPLESFIKVIRSVKANYDEILLMGGQDSVAACNLIMENCCEQGLRNLSNQTSLIETLEIISKAKLLICPDTAALHMAVITNTQAIVITNGTNALRFTNYPQNVKTIYPPYFRLNLNNEKMYYSRNEIQTISYEKVIEAISS